MSRTELSCAALISRFACLPCQVLFPLAREVEVCVQEIHPTFPSTIWPCLSPFTTRGGSEKFHLKPLMTPGFFRSLRFCRLVELRRGHAQTNSSRGSAAFSSHAVSEVLRTTDVDACKEKAGTPQRTPARRSGTRRCASSRASRTYGRY